MVVIKLQVRDKHLVIGQQNHRTECHLIVFQWNEWTSPLLSQVTSTFQLDLRLLSQMNTGVPMDTGNTTRGLGGTIAVTVRCYTGDWTLGLGRAGWAFLILSPPWDRDSVCIMALSASVFQGWDDHSDCHSCHLWPINWTFEVLLN